MAQQNSSNKRGGGGHLLAPNEQYKKALQDAEDEILKLKQSLEILKQDSKEDLREIQTL